MKKIILLVFIITSNVVQGEEICNQYCDGRDPNQVSEGVREAAKASISGRDIRLYISDIDNMAYATISGGSTGDEVWLDRSFDGAISWEDGSLLGFTTIPSGQESTTTLMYNVDNDAKKGLGALRACGRGLNPSPLTCTDWARSTVMAETPVDAAATALMQYYNGALWNTIGWWNGANALTALIQYMRITGKI